MYKCIYMYIREMWMDGSDIMHPLPRVNQLKNYICRYGDRHPEIGRGAQR